MTFLDTNILVYALDSRDVRKQQISSALIEEALASPSAFAISVQTLSEFVNVALRKLKRPAQEVSEFLTVYRAIPTILPDGVLVSRGLEIASRYGLQFYDSMMLAAAERAGADVFYSEDLNAGQRYAGILAVNPFATEAD